MLGAEVGRLRPRDIEFVSFCRTVRGRQVARGRVNRNGNDRIRFREIGGRFGGQSLPHEPLPNGRSDCPSGKTFSPGSGRIISYPNAGYYLRGIADKPGIPIIVGGAGLTGGGTFL